MSSGLFASQFNPVSPYNPVGLDTGTPQVGLNLRTPKSSKPPTEPAPVNAPVGSGPAAYEAGAQGAAANAGANAGANANAGVSAQNVAAQQAANQTYSKLMQMTARDTAGGNPATITAPAHAPAQADNGLLGGFGHWAAHTFDSARHGTAAAANNFGGIFAQQNGIPNQYSPHLTGNGGPLGVLNASNYVPPNAASGLPGNPAVDVAAPRQGININSIKLNQGSPQYDVQAPTYSALPRGWSAGEAIGPGNTRLAIESGGYNPYQSMIDTPSYSAMPRGLSAANREANFMSMTGSEPGGAGWSAVTNPAQFSNVSSDAANSLPRGTQAGGGWESDIGTFFRDLGEEGE